MRHIILLAKIGWVAVEETENSIKILFRPFQHHAELPPEVFRGAEKVIVYQNMIALVFKKR